MIIGGTVLNAVPRLPDAAVSPVDHRDNRKIADPNWRFSPPPVMRKACLLAALANPLRRERSIDRRTTDPQRRVGTVSTFIVADMVCVSEGLFR